MSGCGAACGGTKRGAPSAVIGLSPRLTDLYATPTSAARMVHNLSYGLHRIAANQARRIQIPCPVTAAVAYGQMPHARVDATGSCISGEAQLRSSINKCPCSRSSYYPSCSMRACHVISSSPTSPEVPQIKSAPACKYSTCESSGGHVRVACACRERVSDSKRFPAALDPLVLGLVP